MTVKKSDAVQLKIQFDQQYIKQEIDDKKSDLAEKARRDICQDLSEMPDVSWIPNEFYLQNYQDYQKEDLVPLVSKIHGWVDIYLQKNESKYVDILLDIYRKKIEEFVSEKWISNSLNESDVRHCFDLAVLEYNSMYPDDWKNKKPSNANIANKAEKLI